MAEQVGKPWRHTCLTERRKAAPVGAEELADAWWRLSVRTRALEFAVNDDTAPTAGA